MNRKQQVEFNRQRRMSGWNHTQAFDEEDCTSPQTGRLIDIPDGCAFLKKPRYPDGKIVRDGRLTVTQPCAVESESHKKRIVHDALIDHLSCPAAWTHLQLENAVLEVESVVPRRIGKHQYEVDATLRLSTKKPQAAPSPGVTVAPAS